MQEFGLWIRRITSNSAGAITVALIAAGAQPVCGDLKERASLDPSSQGIDFLVTTANSTFAAAKITYRL